MWNLLIEPLQGGMSPTAVIYKALVHYVECVYCVVLWRIAKYSRAKHGDSACSLPQSREKRYNQIIHIPRQRLLGTSFENTTCDSCGVFPATVIKWSLPINVKRILPAPRFSFWRWGKYLPTLIGKTHLMILIVLVHDCAVQLPDAVWL